MVGVAIQQWLKGIGLIQFILILVVDLCLVIIGLMFLLNWTHSRSLNRISDLLYQMDALVKLYVNETELNKENSKALMEDVAEFLHMNPLDAVGAIFLPTPTEREESFDKLQNQLKSVFDGADAKKSLNELLMLGGLLNSHNLGLNRVKNGIEYQALNKKLGQLQKRADSATNNAINNYLLWSDGLYSLLLFINYKNMPDYFKIRLPAKVKAALPLFLSTIGMVIEQRIAEVRDAIKRNKAID